MSHSKPARKFPLGLILIGITTVLIASLILIWISKEPYERVFDNLSTVQSKKLINKLVELNIPYKSKQGGMTVLVPKSRSEQAKIQLATTGILQSSQASFTFDSNNTNDIQEKLEQTIKSIEAVSDAKISLTMDPDNTSALVTLQLNPNSQITNQQIKGIQNFISASVAGIEPSLVTVLDGKGVVLSKSNIKHMVSKRLEDKKHIEQYLGNKVRRLIEKIFGHNNSIVNINVNMNYEKVSKTSEHLVPIEEKEGAVIRKEMTESEESKPVQSRRRRARSLVSKNINSNTLVEYSFGKTVEQKITNPGTVETISVAVMLPQAATEKQINKLAKLVKATLGLSFPRGDSLEIHSLEFLPDTIKTSAITIQEEINSNRGSPVPAELSESKKGISSKKFAKSLALIISVSVIIGAIIILMLWMQKSESTLTVEEREKVKKQIKQWLNEESEGV